MYRVVNKQIFEPLKDTQESVVLFNTLSDATAFTEDDVSIARRDYKGLYIVKREAYHVRAEAYNIGVLVTYTLTKHEGTPPTPVPAYVCITNSGAGGSGCIPEDQDEHQDS